mmetsp:Transcript_2616/g.4047  ORF Transcript_2616/g.4047 Transcript_2616/m.4047 type:complete len:106 (+) Transcript_2616:237-554(+)
MLYDNIADRSLQVGQFFEPKIDQINLEEGSSKVDISFTTIKQEKAISLNLEGPLTTQGVDTILTSPVRLPLEGFVASHKLAVSLVSNIQSGGDLELKVSVYLQQR